MAHSSVAREAERDRCLNDWASANEVELTGLDVGQQWVVFAALTFLAFSGRLGPLRRMVAYLLSHSGLGLSSVVIGAVVGTTDRAVRKGRQFEPREFWTRLQSAKKGHAPPKLRKDQVGLVAKYLAEHKRASVAELLGFIQKAFGVQLDRLTLRRFLKRYGLGCLREETVEDTPFLPDAPHTEAPSP